MLWCITDLGDQMRNAQKQKRREMKYVKMSHASIQMMFFSRTWIYLLLSFLFGAKAYVCWSCSTFAFKYSIRNIKYLSFGNGWKGLNQPAFINHECICWKQKPDGKFIFSLLRFVQEFFHAVAENFVKVALKCRLNIFDESTILKVLSCELALGGIIYHAFCDDSMKMCFTCNDCFIAEAFMLLQKLRSTKLKPPPLSSF